MDIAELVACLDLESEPTMVGRARGFVAQTLAEWELDALVDDAELITSELVSNGVLHARTALRLTLRSDGLRWVRIEVYDQNSRMPLAAPCPDDATSGRGLAMVERLGTSWGVVREHDGKTVWAELLLAGEPDGIDLRSATTVDDALDRIEDSRDSRAAETAEISVSCRYRAGRTSQFRPSR